MEPLWCHFRVRISHVGKREVLTDMRVLLIDHAPLFGGAESFLLDLVGALDLKEWTPVIVTDPRSPVFPRFQASGKTVLATPLPRINKNPDFAWRLVRAGRQLAHLAAEIHADLLHSFTARTHLIASVASQISGIPLLWRLCDDTLPGWLLRPFAGTPRVIVGVSEWITRVYPGLHFDGLVPDGSRQPPEISQTTVRPELGFAEGEYVIAHVGRLVRWKGQDTFIRALGQASKHLSNLRGLVVGDWNPGDEGRGLLGGGETYYRELTSLASELELNTVQHKKVVFTGFMQRPERAFAAADVVAHTSVLPEPFGRVVIEAMMAGRPVVAAKAGALPEIVIDGKTGLLTQPGDSNALANVLVQLSSANLRAQLGEAGRQRALQLFTLERMTRSMEHFYRLAVEKRKSDHAHRD